MQEQEWRKCTGAKLSQGWQGKPCDRRIAERPDKGQRRGARCRESEGGVVV